MALQANVNRDAKKHPKPYSAKDFHPYPNDGKEEKAKFVRGLTTEERDLTHSWAEKLHSKNG